MASEWSDRGHLWGRVVLALRGIEVQTHLPDRRNAQSTAVTPYGSLWHHAARQPEAAPHKSHRPRVFVQHHVHDELQHLDDPWVQQGEGRGRNDAPLGSMSHKFYAICRVFYGIFSIYYCI